MFQNIHFLCLLINFFLNHKNKVSFSAKNGHGEIITGVVGEIKVPKSTNREDRREMIQRQALKKYSKAGYEYMSSI